LKLLLDTNVVIRWMASEEAGRTDAGRLIADPANEILLSIVSLWEIVVKSRIGKLDVALDAVIADAAANGFNRLGLEDAHLRALRRLPKHHRDPFDHLLIAQAIIEGAAFVTADRKLEGYPVELIRA